MKLDLTSNDYLYYFIVLGLIVVALLSLSWLFKKLSGRNGTWGKNHAGKRLQVLSCMPIDVKRQLVLIRFDQQELLILVSDTSNILLSGPQPLADLGAELPNTDFKKILDAQSKVPDPPPSRSRLGPAQSLNTATARRRAPTQVAAPQTADQPEKIDPLGDDPATQKS